MSMSEEPGIIFMGYESYCSHTPRRMRCPIYGGTGGRRWRPRGSRRGIPWLVQTYCVCVAIANTVSASPSTPRLWWGRWRVTQAHGQAGGPLSGAATWNPRSVPNCSPVVVATHGGTIEDIRYDRRPAAPSTRGSKTAKLGGAYAAGR